MTLIQYMTTTHDINSLVSESRLIVQSTEVEGIEESERVEDVLLQECGHLQYPLHHRYLWSF